MPSSPQPSFASPSPLNRPLLFLVSIAALFFAVKGSSAETPPASTSTRAYMDFALRNLGDFKRGEQVFARESSACLRCHSIERPSQGQASDSKVGPPLHAIGNKFSRRDLIRSVLEPSATIAVGYGTTGVTTRQGDEFQGVIQQSTAQSLELKLADASVVVIPTRDVVEQRDSLISLMPEGLHAALSMQEFTDLMAYLETLREGEDSTAFTAGMPARIPIAAQSVQFTPLFKTNVQVRRPSWFGLVPGFKERWIIFEHEGRSWFINQEGEPLIQKSFLDLSGTVRVGGGSGLLSLAFHPRFPQNRRYFITYQTLRDQKPHTIVEERLFAEDFGGDSGKAPREILSIECSTTDHTGGGMAFGTEGYLYIGMGDSGPQRDPQGHGQDMSLLLGKLLRIDVDQTSPRLPYRVPDDNPFVNQAGARPEIWALGFREPWRMCFDPRTQDLWVGDVGQDAIEEVTLARAGENHGWNVFEGFTPYSARYRRENARYTPPVFAYTRRHGASITGGFVYRGRRAPQLVGRYICGDFNSRRIWALSQTQRVLQSIVEIGQAPGQLVSFAEDQEGELCVAGYDNATFHRMDLSTVDLNPRETVVMMPTSEHEAQRWRYTLKEPDIDWMKPAFSDAAWAEGPGGFGSPGTPNTVVRTEWRSPQIWLRRTFTLNAPASSKAPLLLRIHHDEDVVVYLDGVEIHRGRGWTTDYTEIALGHVPATALKQGSHVLAIHCRQNSGGQYIDAGLLQLAPRR